MTSNRILGIALASVAAGFLTVAAPTFAACGVDHKATENEGTKPITAEKGKPAPTVDSASTKVKG
jgi:hypothetical protein